MNEWVGALESLQASLGTPFAFGRIRQTTVESCSNITHTVASFETPACEIRPMRQVPPPHHQSIASYRNVHSCIIHNNNNSHHIDYLLRSMWPWTGGNVQMSLAHTILKVISLPSQYTFIYRWWVKVADLFVHSPLLFLVCEPLKSGHFKWPPPTH